MGLERFFSQNMSQITITGFRFNTQFMYITTNGLLALKWCEFRNANVRFFIQRNVKEQQPYVNLLEYLVKNAGQQIIIHKTNFLGIEASLDELSFVIHDVVRTIIVSQCCFISHNIRWTVGKRSLLSQVSMAQFRVENSTFIHSHIHINAWYHNSFVVIQMSQNILNASGLRQYPTGGPFAMNFDLCTFVDIRYAPIYSEGALALSISNCFFEMPSRSFCKADVCLIYVDGKTAELHFMDVITKLLFPECRLDWYECIDLLQVQIVNTRIIGSPAVNSYMIKVIFNEVLLKKCTFKLPDEERSFTGAAVVSVSGHSRSRSVQIENVDFEASKTHIANNFIFMIMDMYDVEIDNISMHCPKHMSAMQSHQKLTYSHEIIFSCNRACQSEQYTFEQGTLDIGRLFSINKTIKTISVNRTVPICYPCPLGASCDSQIRALPNHWGYQNQNNQITMIRCPEGYCCQTDETCQDLSVCNEERTGTLCGVCKTNHTESFLSTKCIPVENCNIALLLFLYTLAAMIYAVSLLTAESIKNRLLDLAKKLYQHFRKACHHTKEPSTFVINEQSNTKEEGSIKYLQILFYYVQDASLFATKVHDDQEKKNMLVKFMQMSPDIIGSMYSQVSNFCLYPISTAVSKVWLKLFFGPCVMLILLVFYVIQLSLAKCKIALTQSHKMFSGSLTNAFLLVYLFSYQQMIKGAFTLIQCVPVHDFKVLYIQGDVKCYQWWQMVVQAYIFMQLIPVLLSFSCLPFLVQEKKLSVKRFFVSCLLPMPSYIFCLLTKVINMLRPGILPENHHNNESLDTICQEMDTLSSDTDIATEYSNESIYDIDEDKQASIDDTEVYGSREQVVHVLLEHYEPMNFCGIRFTWLGIHKLFRIFLVACNTYITEPLTRLLCMTVAVLTIFTLNVVIKPYRDSRANTTASLSYAANLCIAAVNAVRAIMMTFDCRTNCNFRSTVLKYLDLCEDVLLFYIPLVSVALWVVLTGFQKLSRKHKDE